MSISSADIAMLTGQVPQPSRRGKRVDNLDALADLDTKAGRARRRAMQNRKTQAKRRADPEKKAKLAAYLREYRKKNAERLAAYKRAWCERNRERVRVNQRTTRRRKWDAMTPEERQLLKQQVKERVAAALERLGPEEAARRKKEHDRKRRLKRKHEPRFKELASQRQKRHYDKDPEAARARVRRYYAEHREEIQEKRRARRAAVLATQRKDQP